MAKTKQVKGKIKQPKRITDGRLHAPERAGKEYFSLDQIFNEKAPLSVFKEETVEDLQESLSQMNLADMQVLASKAGLLPIYDRDVLKQRIVNAFKVHLKKMKPMNLGNAEKVKSSDGSWRDAMRSINGNS